MHRYQSFVHIALLSFTIALTQSIPVLADPAPSPPTSAIKLITREGFDDYIRRFNARDTTAFEDYIAPDMHMLNGTLEFDGIQGMKDHYTNKIWPYYKEELHVERFVSDDKHIAIQMWAHFISTTTGDTLFGPTKVGETFDFHGLIMYDIRNNRFSRITVAYNSFLHTYSDGQVVNMGIPH